METKTAFETELTQAIRKTIASVKSTGTVGMSDENLWQLTVGRIQRDCPNAPVGTNCAYVAREAFDAIVSKAPFNRFVYPHFPGPTAARRIQLRNGIKQ